MPNREIEPRQKSNANRTALACAALVAGMTGLAFASSPLYDAFCKATGYDGTPRQGAAPAAPAAQAGEGMVVHFDTNVAASLPWKFRAESRQVSARLGETTTVFFHVKNVGTVPSTGIATFNVQPGLMGGYFVKVECFCFKEQTLQPGETLDVPVVFYIEPAVRTDSNTAHLAEMTLSYTYFASKNGAPVTAALTTTGDAGRKTDF